MKQWWFGRGNIGWFYRTLSSKARVKFLAAVFFTFAPFWILSVSRFTGHRPLFAVLIMMVFSGVMGVGWAYAFIRDLRLLLVVIPGQFAAGILFTRYGSPLGFQMGPPSPEGLGCILTMVLGYIFFVRFINGEGATSFRLQTEMAMAQQIHSRLVPPIDRATQHLEVFGNSIPSSAMGGDLLDMVEEDGKVGLFVADVSGHGVQAGVVMAMIKSAIRADLLASRGMEGLLGGLNRLVAELGEPALFVTLACVQWDGTSPAEYALAGHLPILHYVREEWTLRKLHNEHLPLGVSTEAVYRAGRVELSPGDLLVLLTDGLTEVLDGEGREFGEGGIEALIAENAEKPLPELYASIVEAVGRFGRQTDDQCFWFVSPTPVMPIRRRTAGICGVVPPERSIRTR